VSKVHPTEFLLFSTESARRLALLFSRSKFSSFTELEQSLQRFEFLYTILGIIDAEKTEQAFFWQLSITTPDEGHFRR
jgi:hypothetical protein